MQLIDDVLDVSRIVSGQLRVDIRACELTDVINAGVNVVRAAAEAQGIALHVRLDPSASGASRLARMDWAGPVSNLTSLLVAADVLEHLVIREGRDVSSQAASEMESGPNKCHMVEGGS